MFLASIVQVIANRLPACLVVLCPFRCQFLSFVLRDVRCGWAAESEREPRVVAFQRIRFFVSPFWVVVRGGVNNHRTGNV